MKVTRIKPTPTPHVVQIELSLEDATFLMKVSSMLDDFPDITEVHADGYGFDQSEVSGFFSDLWDTLDDIVYRDLDESVR